MALPVVSGREVAKALEKVGYVLDRQKGSHVVLRETVSLRRVTVPDHKEVAKGTLRTILRSVGVTVNEFLELLG